MSTRARQEPWFRGPVPDLPPWSGTVLALRRAGRIVDGRMVPSGEQIPPLRPGETLFGWPVEYVDARTWRRRRAREQRRSRGQRRNVRRRKAARRS